MLRDDLSKNDVARVGREFLAITRTEGNEVDPVITFVMRQETPICAISLHTSTIPRHEWSTGFSRSVSLVKSLRSPRFVEDDGPAKAGAPCRCYMRYGDGSRNT